MRTGRRWRGGLVTVVVTTAMTALAMLAGTVPPAAAHDVNHSVAREGAAVVVTIGYADGASFDYESFEVFRPGETVPFQVGRTDGRGRVIFLPDTAGSWRLRAFTADGHGMDVAIEIDSAGAVTGGGDATANRWTRLIGGLAILLGAFGLMSLFYGKTKGGG